MYLFVIIQYTMLPQQTRDTLISYYTTTTFLDNQQEGQSKGALLFCLLLWRRGSSASGTGARLDVGLVALRRLWLWWLSGCLRLRLARRGERYPEAAVEAAVGGRAFGDAVHCRPVGGRDSRAHRVAQHVACWPRAFRRGSYCERAGAGRARAARVAGVGAGGGGNSTRQRLWRQQRRSRGHEEWLD